MIDNNLPALTFARRQSRVSPVRHYLGRLLIYVPLIVLLIFAVGPLLLAWFTAFKTGEQILKQPFAPPMPPTLDNLVEAWTVGRFSVYFKNSVVISVANVGGVLVVSTLAGYAFARLRFPGQRILLFLFLAGLTVPVAAIIIPLYLTMRDLHLLNTHGAVVLAQVSLVTPIFILIMRAFFKDLPRELEDSARVDGASEFQIFWQVMLPLVRPGLMTIALLEFLWSWNALLLPLVFLVTDDLRTLPIGMLFYQGRFSVDYGLMCAGGLISSLAVTVLFRVVRRTVGVGVGAGAVRGGGGAAG
ncbi:MAG: carbohydrate ABC transporter permease, partial [Chloroflexi bacterium]|nr:carbohydrate ABC transporter permease [Chloroflexota bacterium]